MGTLIFVEDNEVMPSQDFIKENTVRHIFSCYNEQKELPPSPIVRLSEDKKNYIAIDGHNLLAVNGFLGKKTKVYVANSPEDKITSKENTDPDALIKRNFELKTKFDACLLEVKKTQQKGIVCFNDLRNKYPLVNWSTLGKTYKG